jgi:hypothetical protein
MANIIYVPKGDEAVRRKLRRRAAAGELTQIATGIYYPADGGPVEDALRTQWPGLVGYLFPNGVITDLTGLTHTPERDDKTGLLHVFVSSPAAPRTVQIAGMVIHARRGVGPVAGDLPYMGSWVAGPDRRYLDNMASSRARSGPARTAGPAVIEERLEKECSAKGEAHLNSIRDGARDIAPLIGREAEFEALDALIGGLLRTRDTKLKTKSGRARAAGTPIDEDCIDRILTLRTSLMVAPTEAIQDPNTSIAARRVSSFIEAFFSNYIEGTRFLVDEAREIVFDGKIPQSRPQDGHDVLSTYAKLMEPPRPRLPDMTAEQFVLNLQVDHADLMRQRPDVGPGKFKEAQNRAGNTVFVSPEKVYGTLLEGFGHINSVSDPFARALLTHFLISDVHPFNDGNGRMSRLAMSREMISHGLCHVVVPTVFRQDYLSAMRAMTRQNNPDILIRSLQKCQEISAACAAADLDEAVTLWASTHAFLEEDRHASFSAPPETPDVIWRNGVPAPKRYWEHLDHDEASGTGVEFF